EDLAEVGNVVEGPFDLGQRVLVPAGARDDPDPSGELTQSVHDASLISYASPAVGSAQHGRGGAVDLAVRTGGGIEPQCSELTFGHLGAGLITDLRTDRRVDVDPGPVAVAAVADEADLGGTVVADEAGVGKDGG